MRKKSKTDLEMVKKKLIKTQENYEKSYRIK